MAFTKWFQFLFPLMLFLFCLSNVNLKMPYIKLLMGINFKLNLFLMRNIYKNNFSKLEKELLDGKKAS